MYVVKRRNKDNWINRNILTSKMQVIKMLERKASFKEVKIFDLVTAGNTYVDFDVNVAKKNLKNRYLFWFMMDGEEYEIEKTDVFKY